jgi:hypothetical protein
MGAVVEAHQQEGVTRVCHACPDSEVAPFTWYTRASAAHAVSRANGIVSLVSVLSWGEVWRKGEQRPQCRLSPGSERADLLRHAVPVYGQELQGKDHRGDMREWGKRMRK